MLKKILAVLAMLYAAASFAAVDVNKATAADLDGLRGIGPVVSSRILDERKKGNFKDWNDFIVRIKGVGEGNAAKFSAEGMTVNGEAFKGPGAMPAKADAKPAATTTVAKADAKMTADEAKAKKAADKQAKADAKKAKADEAKAKKDGSMASTSAAKPVAAASAAK